MTDFTLAGVDLSKNKAFTDAIRGEHQQAIRVTFLDVNLNKSTNESSLNTCLCNNPDKNVTNFISDGNVDVDVDRLIRRTAELTILNPDGRFTPRRSIDVDTDADSDKKPEPSLIGYVYLNRYVRIERGVHLRNNQHIYAVVGTFMIDIAEIIAERNMTVVNLTLSDLGKRLSKSYFSSPYKYPEGTLYNDIIRDILDDAGVPNNLIGGIDELTSRDLADRKIKKVLKFERGDSRGEKLKELCDKWDIDAYFNPYGKFVTEDKVLSKRNAPRWEFSSEDVGEGNGMILSIQRTLSDDNLFNHIIVVGTGNDKKTYVSKIRNDSNSKMSINQIGDRAYYLETDRASSQAETDTIANRHWKKRLSLEESVALDVVCVPFLEGNDIITISDPTYTKIYSNKNNNKGKRYRLKRFNIPLVTSKQHLEVSDTVSIDEL